MARRSKEIVLLPHRRMPMIKPDVFSIRQRTGYSQKEFAAVYGFSLSTVRAWEQGQRAPDMPTRYYLRVIEKNWRYVSRIIRDTVSKSC